MRVVLIRHGQTDWNRKNVAIGQTDVDLSEDGIKQLGYLEKRFEGVRFSRILCSDLKRCVLTGEAVARATGAPLEIRTEVRERSFGDWEGRDYAQFPTTCCEWQGSKVWSFTTFARPTENRTGTSGTEWSL